MSAAQSIRPIRRHAHLFSLCVTVLAWAGCTAPRQQPPIVQQDPPVTPDANRELARLDPPWAFDAPQYARPDAEPDPDVRRDVSEPLHYYLGQRTLHIRRPLPRDAHEPPRVAISVTADGGATWQRVGFFGRGQTFFPYAVERDGDYGVRIDPAETEAATRAARPAERIYHVDATPPAVRLSLSPDTNSLMTGQTITLAWQVEDRFLLERPVQVSVSTSPGEWRILAPEQTAEGAIAYTVADAGGAGTLAFRVEALDRAGNVGLGRSAEIAIVDASASNAMAQSAPPEEPTIDELNAAYVYVPFTPQDEAWMDWPPCVEDEVAEVAMASTDPDSAETILTERMELQPDIRALSLVPVLPAVDDDRSTFARPWQELGRRSAAVSTVVWALPKPKFLSELARSIEAQWREADLRDVAAMPPAADQPHVARAGDADQPPQQ